ncbi:hypothetical protein K0U83_18735 [bacterium]|nr:hypothetical protein [bacterium]
MSKWSRVGDWLKDNAGTGTALVGSLLTGNVPGAIAAGVSLVSGATGTNDPAQALAALQADPQTVARLKELYYQNEASVRQHIEALTRIELEAHQTTQATIQSGDRAEDPFVRRTRPAQSWCSLIAAFVYVLYTTAADKPTDFMILSALLTLPWAYAGLRQIGKGIDSIKRKG